MFHTLQHFGVSIFSYAQSIEESFGSSANSSVLKISGSEFLVKINFSWKMISAKQRFKKNKIGKWQAPGKHELSHSTVKISNRTATTRNSIYFNKHWKSFENIKHK